MKRQNFWGYIFTLPFMINVIILVMFPVIFSTYISFTEWDLFNSPKWVGLDNWTATLQSREFWISMRNILFFALVFVPLQTLFAFFIAFLLNQALIGKSIFRLFYFLPVVTPWLAAGVVWAWMFNYEYGVMNWFLDFIGLTPIKWIDSNNWMVVMGTIALVNVWKGMGQSMIILLAGMQNVSTELLEAAEIDGASSWQKLKSIVFPLVSPMLYLVMILSTISAFQAFDVFLGLFGSIEVGIPERSTIPNIMIYRDAFLLFKMGTASSTAWILFLIILIFTLFQRYFEKKWVHYE